MTSTTTARPSSTRRALRPALVLGFWLGAWQAVAVLVDQHLLLATPVEVVLRLGELVVTADFWATIAHSLLRIGAGFTLGAVVGTLGATLAATWQVVDDLTAPLVAAVRSTPVVSFIVLVLMWADSGRLALVVSAMMVTPIVHANVLQGIRQRDRGLLEVAAVFEVPLLRRLRAVDVPAVLPYAAAAAQIGVGLAWKSGVAAEVIGLPQGSIGEQLYQAKILLSTADLFAWTVVVVAISHAVERLVLVLLGRSRRSPALGRVA